MCKHGPQSFVINSPYSLSLLHLFQFYFNYHSLSTQPATQQVLVDSFEPVILWGSRGYRIE